MPRELCHWCGSRVLTIVKVILRQVEITNTDRSSAAPALYVDRIFPCPLQTRSSLVKALQLTVQRNPPVTAPLVSSASSNAVCMSESSALKCGTWTSFFSHFRCQLSIEVPLLLLNLIGMLTLGNNDRIRLWHPKSKEIFNPPGARDSRILSPDWFAAKLD